MSNQWNPDKIVDLMRRDDSVEAPTNLIKWAKNLAVTRQPQPSILKRLSAVLKFDLMPETPVLGERSARAVKARQMLFEAGDNAVDIRVELTGRSASIKAQILGAGFGYALIRLEATAHTAETKSTSNSSFEFSKVPRGIYRLTALGKDVELAIEKIEL